MSKHDLRARPIYHHKRESIDAHLTIVFAALAVTRHIERNTGWSIRKFVTTARRFRTIHLRAGQHILTAEEPLPANLRNAPAMITERPAHQSGTSQDCCGRSERRSSSADKTCRGSGSRLARWVQGAVAEHSEVAEVHPTRRGVQFRTPTAGFAALRLARPSLVRKRVEGRLWWAALGGVFVRRRPTLPHRLRCSTIGAGGLSFRVRNVAGRFPSAMAAVTL
jgi:hypothetical protein